MIVERYNEAAALAYLMEPTVSTRSCILVKPEDTILRIVVDTMEHTVDGNLFSPAPFVKLGAVTSGDGEAADTMQIIMDGKDMIVEQPETPETILQKIVANRLRDRPIMVGRMVLNVDNPRIAIGLIPDFVGFIDNVKLGDDEGPVLNIGCASYRGFAARRPIRYHSDTDHQSRFPGDEAANGSIKWNSKDAGAGSAGPSNIGRQIGFGFISGVF